MANSHTALNHDLFQVATRSLVPQVEVNGGQNRFLGIMTAFKGNHELAFDLIRPTVIHSLIQKASMAESLQRNLAGIHLARRPS